MINHPDKANGEKEKEAIFDKANSVYKTQKVAIHILGLVNKRVDYDEEGEVLREIFGEAFEARYPIKTFTEQASEVAAENLRAAVYAKSIETRKKNEAEKAGKKVSLESTAKYWVRNGQQDNQTRVRVYNDIKAGQTPATISRYICTHLYDTPKDLSLLLILHYYLFPFILLLTIIQTFNKHKNFRSGAVYHIVINCTLKLHQLYSASRKVSTMASWML